MNNEAFDKLTLPLLTTSNPDYAELYNYFQKSNLNKVDTLKLLTIREPRFINSQIVIYTVNRIECLKDKYMMGLIEDLLYKYPINDLKSDLPMKYITKLNKESFIGYTLEAFVVRKINNDDIVKKYTYKWAMGLDKLPDDDDIANIQAIGRGSIFCRTYLPDEYNEQSKMDIVFVRKINGRYDLVYSNKLGRCAEIQVKAVRSYSQINDIVEAIMHHINQELNINYSFSGKLSFDKKLTNCYRKTLTLLLDKNNVHTKTRVIESLNRALKKERIPFDPESVIKSPQDIGIDQQEVNEYYDLLSYFYDHPKEFNFNMIDDNIKNSLLFASLTKNEPIDRFFTQTRQNILSL